ncbi:MAG: cob(I)yrinic acid a,c-diamide adenosyltransferase [Thaumarchaeota archaeon]|nr:cob(I)yrinic acid a,c-diamide adenosyltransferase [Candidatus Geocrenenecus arthurdayi]
MSKMGKYGRGDTGETYLLTGEKVWKDDPRLEVIGGLDELSSIIGLAKSFIEDEDTCRILEAIQGHLFTIGYRIQFTSESLEDINGEIKNSLEDLESWVKDYESKLPILKKFILPGGHESAAILHVARAITRRVERRIITLSRREPIQSEILAYINRLSTLLFLLARYMNLKRGYKEKEWTRKI